MKHNVPFLLLVLLALVRCVWYFRTPPSVSLNTPVPILVRPISDIRSYLTTKVSTVLPSPHSELLLGMSIGVDGFSKLPVFKEKLRTCGVIHVVVVSGFNISLVSTILLKFLGSKYVVRNVLVVCIFTLLYALLSGFEPPVIRAWIMGTITSILTFNGRRTAALRVLIFSAVLMILISPENLKSMSFQLSFLATTGLIIYSPYFTTLLNHIKFLPNLLKEDIAATFSAQILVLPLISYYFGDVSLLGFLVNPIILWTVPVSTFLGMLLCLSSYISGMLAQVFGYLVFPFLDIFVFCVEFFSRLSFFDLSVKVPLYLLLTYYLVLGLLFVFMRKLRVLKEPK